MTIHDRENDEHPTRIDPRRWQAQERARHGDADADAGDLRIARALREAAPVDLPADFAARMAARVQRRGEASMLLEQRLLRALGIARIVGSRGGHGDEQGQQQGNGREHRAWIESGHGHPGNWGYGRS